MFKNNKINNKINAESCNNLLENVSNSLENSKNNSYKKDLYPFKIMKQLLIQLGSNVLLDKDGTPYIKKIEDCKFKSILNSIHFYVNTHNIDEIESLLCSKYILKDLKIKERGTVDKAYLFTGTNKIDPSKFGDYYQEHSEYNKVIKKIYEQAQESDVSQKYIKKRKSFRFMPKDCIIDYVPSGVPRYAYVHDCLPNIFDLGADIDIISKDIINIIKK